MLGQNHDQIGFDHVSLTQYHGHGGVQHLAKSRLVEVTMKMQQQVPGHPLVRYERCGTHVVVSINDLVPPILGELPVVLVSELGLSVDDDCHSAYTSIP